MITVYTLPECIQCDLTKRAFDRRGIEFDEVPLTDELMDEFRGRGVLSAPIVVVSPDLWWYGLKPDLIHQTWKAERSDRVGWPQGHDGA
jgi:glutaredoxin-like protein NrdH